MPLVLFLQAKPQSVRGFRVQAGASLGPPRGSGPRCADPSRRLGLHAAALAAAATALPGLRQPGWARGPRSLHVGPRRPPRPGARFHFKPPPAARRPPPFGRSRRSCPRVPEPREWRRLRNRGALLPGREDAHGPRVVDNEATGAAARPGPCAPRPHLPARALSRLTGRLAWPCRPMARRPGPGPRHSGGAAYRPAGARGALPAA